MCYIHRQHHDGRGVVEAFPSRSGTKQAYPLSLEVLTYLPGKAKKKSLQTQGRKLNKLLRLQML